MAKTFTHLELGGGEPPFATTAKNPPAAAALVLSVGINGDGITPTNINTPTGCRSTWTLKNSWQQGSWAYKQFIGTGTVTNEAVTITTTGEVFGAEWLVDQIAADGTLSFPSNDDSATGVSGGTASVTLGAFANPANGVYAFAAVETGDGVTAGSGFTELADGFAVGHTLFSEYRTDSDTSVDCTFNPGSWGIAAFEVAEGGAAIAAIQGHYRRSRA